MRRLFSILLVSSLIWPQTLRAEATREFIMSCTYGVLAGTLVGAASLAFTEKPGENLNRIARGASLGLYAGIALGVYIVYAVPSEEEQAIESQTGGSASLAPQFQPRWALLPTIDFETQKLTGALLSAELLRF